MIAFAEIWARIGKIHAWQHWPQQALAEVARTCREAFDLISALETKNVSRGNRNE